MKTIKEAAKEYAISLHADDCHLSISEIEMYAKTDFEAGVEFAQRWIPVKEELPPSGEIVLLSIENCEIDVVIGFYMNSEFIARLFIPIGIDNVVIKNEVTHWRQIKLK